jgi:hypothetical protein
MVTAHNFGLNDATIIESARYPHAWVSHPYPIIITLIFPNSSLIISSPTVDETNCTAHLPINVDAICAPLIRYFPTKNTKNRQHTIISNFAIPEAPENGLYEL